MSGLQVIQEVATKVGIGSLTGQKSVHALKEGYPIQFFEGLDRNNPAIRGIIRFDDETKDKLLKDTLMQDKTVIGSKLKPKSIDVKGGIVSLKWPRRLFIGFPKTGCDRRPVLECSGCGQIDDRRARHEMPRLQLKQYQRSHSD